MVLKSMRCWISPFLSFQSKPKLGPAVLRVGFAGFSTVLLLGVVAGQFAKGFVLFPCPKACMYVYIPHRF